ncbi:sensor histidine kinase [Mesoterricola silvestris]|nr:histidine kinase [Mesoterricola silvestris]
MRRPLTWGAILVFGLLWNVTRWALGHESPPLDGEALAPFAWALFFLVLSPLPWQWTGGPEPGARPFRGLLQAIPFNAFCVLLLLEVLGAGMPGHLGPHGMGRGMMGRGMHGMHAMPEMPDCFQPHRLLLLAAAFLCFAVLLGGVLARMERAEESEDLAVKAAAQARLKALQNQMNPHVLFNAISGVAEMVREDPAGAEKVLVDLAGLLRHLLDHGDRTSLTLAQERQVVEQYLAMEQLRLGRRLQIHWSWDPDLDAREVPPLLLQPLVENAIKHGIGPERAGGELRISLRPWGRGLELEVANTGRSPAGGAQDSIGLRNLKERLALLGADPASSFRLWREGDWTRAVIQLPGGGPAHV